LRFEPFWYLLTSLDHNSFSRGRFSTFILNAVLFAALVPYSRVSSSEALNKQVIPEISIIVVNWNGKPLLNDCLVPLLRQTHAACELILVDNGSSDGSVDWVRTEFSQINLVQLSSNQGFTGGNLAGVEAARGQFIALLNNDTRADERCLDELLLPMVRDSRIGISAAKLLLDGSAAINSAGIGLTTAAVGFDRGYGEDSSLYALPEQVFGACAAGVLYRRSMLEEIGFLDNDFFLYGEDVDLSFRAQIAGWKCVYVPTAIVYHKLNTTARKLSDVHVYYHTRNLEFVWVKNMQTKLMLRYLHHKIFQEFGAFCYLCLRHGKWRPFFRAKKDALKLLPLMLRRRREIQRRRQVSNEYIQSMLTSVFNKAWLHRKISQFLQD
jgi:GT2 family glycosyltransferase